MKGKSKEPIGMILGFIGANGTEIDPLRMKLQRKTYPGAHCLKQFSRCHLRNWGCGRSKSRPGTCRFAFNRKTRDAIISDT